MRLPFLGGVNIFFLQNNNIYLAQTTASKKVVFRDAINIFHCFVMVKKLSYEQETK